MQPTGIAIRLLLSQILTTEQQHQANKKDSTSKESPDSSFIIGVLERLCILTLVILNQYTAISFIIAAKSLARLNYLIGDKDFAEKYLIGTLLSIMIAILCGCLINNIP